MKKIIYGVCICFLALSMNSCKSDKKDQQKDTTPTPVKKAAAFSLKTAQNSIVWTAYKTSDKAPVRGEFKKVNITSGGEGNTAKEAINNTHFSIPVSSIFTKDTSRDFKIRKFFFGVMDQTTLLSGKLVIESDTTGYATIMMNNVSRNLPFTYTLEGKVFKLKATMKISDWKAEKALEALNLACKDLHTGDDGVSKTWDDVALEITSTFQ